MIPKTFESGNYNNLDAFTKKTLPNALSQVRNTLVGKLDEILENMLGGNADIKKTKIDATLVCSSGKVNGINCEIIYTVDDFNVPTAPNSAIKNDIESITEALKVLESIEIKKININVKNGEFSVNAFVPLED